MTITKMTASNPSTIILRDLINKKAINNPNNHYEKETRVLTLASYVFIQVSAYQQQDLYCKIGG